MGWALNIATSVMSVINTFGPSFFSSYLTTPMTDGKKSDTRPSRADNYIWRDLSPSKM